MLQFDERSYFQRRLRDELARCARFHDIFSVVRLEVSSAPGYAPSRRSTLMAARQVQHRLRECDVVAAVFDDTIAVILVGTGPAGVRDAERRIRGALAFAGGAWHLTAYTYPEHADAIQSLDILAAA